MDTLVRDAFPPKPFSKPPSSERSLCSECGEVFGQAGYSQVEIQSEKFVSWETQTKCLKVVSLGTQIAILETNKQSTQMEDQGASFHFPITSEVAT